MDKLAVIVSAKAESSLIREHRAVLLIPGAGPARTQTVAQILGRHISCHALKGDWW